MEGGAVVSMEVSSDDEDETPGRAALAVGRLHRLTHDKDTQTKTKTHM